MGKSLASVLVQYTISSQMPKASISDMNFLLNVIEILHTSISGNT